MAMNLSASALASRFVPAAASLNLQFVSSRARVCSFPRFLGLKNKSLRAQSSESDSARPSFDAIGTVMELYTAGKVDEAFALLKKLKEEASNMSNEAKYSGMIEWLSKTGEDDEAVEFLRKLEEEGVKPEEILSFGDAESELGKLGIHENELKEMGLNDFLLELKKRGFDE